MGAHTFAPRDIVRVTGGNHAGSLAVVIPGDGYQRWEDIKGTPEAAGMVCLSFGVMSGTVVPAEQLELHTPASAISTPARVEGAVVRFTLAEFREEWGDRAYIDGDDDGGFVDYSLSEALMMLEERRASDRRRPGDRIALAAVVVLNDDAVAALTNQAGTVPATPEVPPTPVASDALEAFKPGDRVVELYNEQRPGVVVPREEWSDDEQAASYPDHAVVDFGQPGSHVLVHCLNLRLDLDTEGAEALDTEPAGALTGEPGTVAPLPNRDAHFRAALADAVSSAAQMVLVKAGGRVRSKATFHIGRIVTFDEYDDGETRLHVDYGTGGTVTCPVDAIEFLTGPTDSSDTAAVTR